MQYRIAGIGVHERMLKDIDPMAFRLGDLTLERELWILSDEIYGRLVFGDAVHVSPATLSPELRARTLIVDGASKAYAMNHVAEFMDEDALQFHAAIVFHHVFLCEDHRGSGADAG